MHIIGAGGHAKVIVDIVLANDQQISGVWDENAAIDDLLNFKRLGGLADFKQLNISTYVVAIGNNKVRKAISDELISSSVIAKHPTSIVATAVTIGEGSVLMANSTVNIHTTLGRHVIVNTNASVDHDCKIGDYVHISPQAGLAGNVTVGEGTHVGIGACVIQGVCIGKWVTIGAGSVILKDVPDYAVVVGNPGKIIKYNKIED